MFSALPVAYAMIFVCAVDDTLIKRKKKKIFFFIGLKVEK